MSSRSELEAIADQFDAVRFLAAECRKKLATLQAATWPEEAEFIDRQFAREQLRRLVGRIGHAIDAGLLDDPVYCGAAAWAIQSLASQLCKHPESADYAIDAWQNWDCSEVFDFLAADAPATQKKRRT